MVTSVAGFFGYVYAGRLKLLGTLLSAGLQLIIIKVFRIDFGILLMSAN